MKTRPLALALVPLALVVAGCSVPAPIPSATTAPVPAPVESPTTTDDDAFYAAVDALKADFDGWSFQWLDAGCTDAATPEETPECIALIAAGIAIATPGDALLAGRDLEDDLVPVQTGVSYAVWRGAQWVEAGCDVATAAECPELTFGVVDDLTYTQEWLQLWSR